MTKIVSIQANPRKSYKSPAARMQAETLKAAWNHGAVWSDDDVSLIANGIRNDNTTLEMAYSLGRSYYSTSTARAHIGFAMRHFDVLVRAWEGVE